MIRLLKWSALLLCSSPALGTAQDGGVLQPADGGGNCTTSRECAAPRPHCHSTLQSCVECVGDRNCSSDRICRLDEGICVQCLADADCPKLSPYCVSLRGECVECLTSTNCGDSGIACQDGKCGSCGDGLCGPREVLSRYIFNPTFEDDGMTECALDCGSLCPSTDAGSGLGVFSVGTARLRHLSYGCDSGSGLGIDAFFKWKAPYDGGFAFNSEQASSLTRLQGGCMGFPQECSAGGAALTVSLVAGDEIVIAIEVEDPAPATIVLEIGAVVAPGCDSSPCTPADAGRTGAELCLVNATDRGDPMCSGVECACNHCPGAYDDCKVIPGCREITECMQQKNCIGTECYNSGACRSIIDSFGGVSAPAFRAGAALESCALSFDCELPCETPPADSGVDGGQLCTPDVSVVCSCGDRSGTKRCAADGMAFGPCDCAAAAPSEEDDGCGCRVAGVTGRGSVGAAFGLALALAMRRRRPRSKPKRPSGRIR